MPRSRSSASRRLHPTRTARAAAARVAQARRSLATAREDLARLTPTGHSPPIVASQWRSAERALDAHRSRLLTLPGVVGVGLSYRIRGGVRDATERCITVYVGRKLRPETLRRSDRRLAPQGVRDPAGHRVPIDVVELGTLVRQVSGGDSIGPASAQELGTVGTFAVDDDSGLVVALTAMHVMQRRRYPPGPPHFPIDSPSAVDGAARSLGRLLRGTQHGIDGAAVSIEPPRSASLAVNGIGPIAGWRPLLHPGDVGTAVQMFGARTRAVVFGRIVEPAVELPEHGLDSAILVDIPSAEGDSGAALLDNDRLVLGLLVGHFTKRNLRVFTSIASVLTALRCDIPST